MLVARRVAATVIAGGLLLTSGCAAPAPVAESVPVVSEAAAPPEPTPTPSPSATAVAPSSEPVEVVTARAALDELEVKGRGPKTGYSREAFGPGWFDTDRNGCDTRNDVLRRDLVRTTMKNSCKVLAGSLDPDPYTGDPVRFEIGGASEIDIDHVVALSDAWQKGAAQWTPQKRLAFANDPVNLLAVDAGANRAKSDGDAATWLPPNRAYRCAFVARQVAVKLKYAVAVTTAERDAMGRVLQACPGQRRLEPGPAPTEAALPRSRPAPTPRATPAATARTSGSAPVEYANCDAVRAAGAAPITAGDPGYSRRLDRDGDGVGCE